jgi:SAM-dependent methyltransferase
MSSPSLLHKARTGLRILYQYHGLKFPFVLVGRAVQYGTRKWCGPQTFAFAGGTHRYSVHPYSWNNERVVEVALARDFVRGNTGECLEIGNVLSNYFNFPHDVVDKYERAPGVLNEDVVTFSPAKKYDRIVSVSTLEHVGWDEQPRESDKIVRAINHLKTLLKEGGQMLVTMPLGYNPHVDELIDAGKTGFDQTRFLLRVSAHNRWREAQWTEVKGTRYGAPFQYGNAVLVGTVGGNAGERKA